MSRVVEYVIQDALGRFWTSENEWTGVFMDAWGTTELRYALHVAAALPGPSYVAIARRDRLGRWHFDHFVTVR